MSSTNETATGRKDFVGPLCLAGAMAVVAGGATTAFGHPPSESAVGTGTVVATAVAAYVSGVGGLTDRISWIGLRRTAETVGALCLAALAVVAAVVFAASGWVALASRSPETAVGLGVVGVGALLAASCPIVRRSARKATTASYWTTVVGTTATIMFVVPWMLNLYALHVEMAEIRAEVAESRIVIENSRSVP